MSFHKDNNIQRSKELSILIYSNGLSFLVEEENERWGDSVTWDTENLNEALKNAFDQQAIFSFAYKSVKVYLQKSAFAIAPMAYFLPKELAIYFNENVSWDYELTKNGSLGNVFFLQAIPLNIYSFLHQRFHNLEIVHPGFELIESLLQKNIEGSITLPHKEFTQRVEIRDNALVRYESFTNTQNGQEEASDYFVGQKPAGAKGKVLGYSQVLNPTLAELYS